MSTVEKAIRLYAWKTNYQTFRIVQGEVDSRTFNIQLFSTTIPVDLTNCSVMLYAVKPDSTVVYVECEVLDVENGLVSVTLSEQMAAVEGTVDCWVQVVGEGGTDLRFEGMNLEVGECNLSEKVRSSDEMQAFLQKSAQLASVDQEVKAARGGKSSLAERENSQDTALQTTAATLRGEIAAADTELRNLIEVQKARIDLLSKLEAGSTTGDAELQDIRVDFEGTTHDTAGDAVRSQSSLLSNQIKQIPFMPVIREFNGYLTTGGGLRSTSSEVSKYTEKMPCSPGDVFMYTGRARYSVAAAVFFNRTEVVSYVQCSSDTVETFEIVAPEGCSSVMFCSYIPINGTASPILVVIKANEKISGQITSRIDTVENLNAVAPYENSVNLFDSKSSDNRIGGFYIRETFKELETAAVTHLIFMKAGVQYKFRHYNMFGTNTTIAVFDKEGAYLYSESFEVVEQFGLYTPLEDKFVRLNVMRSELGSFMVCESDKYPEEYVPFNRTCHESVELNARQLKQVVAACPVLAITNSSNLFNKWSDNIRENSILANVDGGLKYYEGLYVSHPIPVNKGVEYKFPFNPNIYGSNVNYAYADVYGNIFRVETFSADSGFATFVATTTSYVIVPVGKNLDVFMFCRADEYPEQYSAYEKQLLPEVTFGDRQKQDIQKIVKDNPLAGKIVSFNGDSICYGAGASGGYGKIIAEKNGMVYQNIGIGGGTISAELFYDDGRARHWISRTISNMREDADYIILEGGVNDASLSVPLGEITDGFTAELDDTTYAGAFESMLKQALERFPGKKIGYIAVHKMATRYSSEYDEPSFYSVSIHACKKWGIPVCDLNIECPPLNYIDSLKQAYTANGDGWHPNEEGYQKYYVPKIEAWMKTL